MAGDLGAAVSAPRKSLLYPNYPSWRVHVAMMETGIKTYSTTTRLAWRGVHQRLYRVVGSW